MKMFKTFSKRSKHGMCTPAALLYPYGYIPYQQQYSEWIKWVKGWNGKKNCYEGYFNNKQLNSQRTSQSGIIIIWWRKLEKCSCCWFKDIICEKISIIFVSFSLLLLPCIASVSFPQSSCGVLCRTGSRMIHRTKLYLYTLTASQHNGNI